MPLIDQLKARQKCQGLKSIELANAVGMAASNLSVTLSGRTDVQSSTLEALAAALDATWVLVPRDRRAAVECLLGEAPDRVATTPFDICDARNRYALCPSCKASSGMGLRTRGQKLAVECECGHRGPEVDVPALADWATWPVPAHERDRQAFEGWNQQDTAEAGRVTHDGAAAVSERVLKLMKGDVAVSIQMPPAATPQGAPCVFRLTPEMVERIRGHFDASTLHMPVMARWPESAQVRDTVLSSDLEGFVLKGTGPTRYDSVETARLSITSLVKALINRESNQGIKFSHPAG
ncbi:hypothetical protein KTD31_01800 [Burkholderia multivorans]|jgi:transcriptional regulator with XRE-family HTH domain|uniref:hypothetical protein n=1 Tax=Burkholderia multivorans TaxID=87883 RepID=UPI001C243E13|nr:hypothetical protein [Burkholderia multivorans]MBU9200137.1 hypothetical protein [Burkholderia multivorans]MDN8078741.1 hypothetical protein [Burkholderia multivorans]